MSAYARSHLCRLTLAVSAAALLGLAAAQPAAAQDYPARPVHLYVPYPAGGPNDVIARLLGQEMSKSLGQQIVIENRPGGSGNIAIEALGRAPADGYAIALPAMAYATNPSLFSKVGYSFDQFAPVSIVTKGPLVLVVHPSLGVKSVKELIDLAKSKPGKLDYGSGGNGSSLHLAAEMFKQQAGVDIQHIPYKGTNDLIADLLTGRVPIAFMSPLIAKSHVDQGKLIALGVTSPQRSSSWPGTPTVAEAGVPGYAVEAWYAVVAPKATPKDVVDKLSREIAKAVQSQEVKDKLATLGNEPVGSTVAEAEKYIADEADRWGKLLKAANIRAD
ncbi:MAG: Bug family tripartite tricarboxylate transporter substrate binding protein [Pseudorhodoplanes sp.]